jgi:OmpR-family two-component system manganese-sensing response regulator
MIVSKKILLIEDDSEMSNLLSSSLSDRYPCTVDVAQDSFEAMNMMTERFYDLVILDWNLPGFNGIIKRYQLWFFHRLRNQIVC